MFKIFRYLKNMNEIKSRQDWESMLHTHDLWCEDEIETWLKEPIYSPVAWRAKFSSL